jgi:hypothetical protein
MHEMHQTYYVGLPAKPIRDNAFRRRHHGSGDACADIRHFVTADAVISTGNSQEVWRKSRRAWEVKMQSSSLLTRREA